MEGIECSGFTFYNGFDSANLAKVVYVPPSESIISVNNNSSKSVLEIPDAEFNLWTKPDCGGTEFENGNRTWFYFGVKAHSAGLLVRLNIVDLNRQGKMYSQGMAPVYRIIPGRPQWERIRDKPVYNTTDDIFTLSFKYKTPENVQSTTYFAFTYPFSCTDLEKLLSNIDSKFQNYTAISEDDIYYKKEVLCRSLGGKDVYLLTISSCHGLTSEREDRLKDLFPVENSERPFKFAAKKIIFVSARVHPGETPSSFVFNGLLSLLLTKDDPVASTLRKLYVFKMIPFLNPDGVSLGHYRTDMRGVNLNRVYLNPSLTLHPPIFAARALIRYYHFGIEKEDSVDQCPECLNSTQNDSGISTKVSHMTLEENEGADVVWCLKCKTLFKTDERISKIYNVIPNINLDKSFYLGSICGMCKKTPFIEETAENIKINSDLIQGDRNASGSGIFLYLDLHGHASKKGIFMYGNHFQDLERNVECMLLPKLMSMNSHHFHFTSCNFTERNMYLRDKRDGMSREGSGRVAVLKLTGLTKSYTLECNYNTGRIVNVLPPTVRESHNKVHTMSIPPKYTPQIYEEVGRSLGASILDLTSQNPCSRVPNSEFHSLSGLRDWLRVCCVQDMDETCTFPTQFKFKNVTGLQNQGKSAHGLKTKSRPTTVKSVSKRLTNKPRPVTVPIDRKENMVVPAPQSSCSYSDSDQRIKSGVRLNKSLGIKSKPKKDFTHKFKPSADKPKTGRNKFKTATTSAQKTRLDSKLHKKQNNSIKTTTNQERKKLRELCVVKSSEGKTVMKFESSEIDGESSMMWKPSSSSQVFLKPGVTNFLGNKINSEAGPSKPTTYRVHNFGKASMFQKSKYKKHSLRRLANPTETGKMDKAKAKRKIKSK